MFQYLASGQPAAEGVDNSHQGAPGWAGERLERQVQGEKSSHHGSRLRKILAVKFSTLFPHLYSAWLTCDHSCILKRTCLYLCIPIVFIIVIVFLYAWCCRGKDGECPKSPEHVLCQVQQTRKVQGGRHLNDLAPLTMSPHFQFRWHSTRSLLRASKLRAEGGELYFQSSYPALRISYRVSIKTRDLETFHSIEEYRVWYLQYRV